MQTSIELTSILKRLLNDGSVEINHQLQELWSGYGAIVRCQSTVTNKTYIVKLVNENASSQPHPRGWNTSTSHQRKLTSYKIEAHFYQYYSHLTDTNCKTPQLIVSEQLPAGQILVMEDLEAAGFNCQVTLNKAGADDTWQSVKQGIKWLAYFHAKFMLGTTENDSGKGLWPIGGYWHLDTRQDELTAMSGSCPNAITLKKSATQIDDVLKSAKYQTLIHGDAKLENMCFNRENGSVAAVDFQYVGRGTGVKDLAYFVGSVFKQDDLFSFEGEILNTYFAHLKDALTLYKCDNNASSANINFDELEAENRLLYPIAWADFHRFLLGWNPQSWKINDYMRHITERALSQLTTL